MKLFLAGDVMTGRGIDQILPHPVDPVLHEPYVKTARRYVALAERTTGPIPAPVSWEYVWGDALDALERAAPAVRIINLETAVTTSDDWWKTKGIHYRMHPANLPALQALGPDVCVLGNNHVLDWGRVGLLETLDVLRGAGMRTAGAGADDAAAAEPAVVHGAAGESDRLVVHAWGTPSAGVPGSWAAGPAEPGVNVLDRVDEAGSDRVIRRVEATRMPGDRTVVSIHWGGNWGYDVPGEQRAFARRLVDAEAADVVFGHSSHHPKGIEVYRGRLILYGAGDFLNDYEGIGGREEFRGDLTVLYFPEIAKSGELRSLRMAPMRVRRFRLERPSSEDVAWLGSRLNRESRRFGSGVTVDDDGWLRLSFG